jgi:hypothetical protein
VRNRLANAKPGELALGAVALCLLLIVVAYGVFLKPSAVRAAGLRNQVREARAFVEEARAYMNRTPLQVLEAGRLYTFDTLSSLPTELDAAAKAVGAVITAIRIGEAAPVQVRKSAKEETEASAETPAQAAPAAASTGAAPAQRSEKSRLMKVPVTIQAEAAYGPLLSLLKHIEQMPRRLAVTGLEVTTIPGEATKLNVKAQMDALLYSPPGKKPTASPAGPAPSAAPAGPSPQQPFQAAEATRGEPSAPQPRGGEAQVPPPVLAEGPPSQTAPPLLGPEPATAPQAPALSTPHWPVPLPRIVTPGRPIAGLTVREALGDGSAWPHLAGTVRARGRGVAVLESGGMRFTFTEGAELAPGVRLANVDTGKVTILKQPQLRGEPQVLVARVGEPLRGVTIQAPGSVDQYPQIVCILKGEGGPVAVVREGGQAYTVRPGDVLAGGVRIKDIGADCVVMEAHGDELRLSVPQLEGPSAVGSGAASPASPPSGRP